MNGNYFNILVKLCDYLRDNGVKSASAALGPVRIDNMGIGYFLYFPALVTDQRRVR